MYIQGIPLLDRHGKRDMELAELMDKRLKVAVKNHVPIGTMADPRLKEIRARSRKWRSEFRKHRTFISATPFDMNVGMQDIMMDIVVSLFAYKRFNAEAVAEGDLNCGYILVDPRMLPVFQSKKLLCASVLRMQTVICSYSWVTPNDGTFSKRFSNFLLEDDYPLVPLIHEIDGSICLMKINVWMVFYLLEKCPYVAREDFDFILFRELRSQLKKLLYLFLLSEGKMNEDVVVPISFMKEQLGLPVKMSSSRITEKVIEPLKTDLKRLGCPFKFSIAFESRNVHILLTHSLGRNCWKEHQREMLYYPMSDLLENASLTERNDIIDEIIRRKLTRKVYDAYRYYRGLHYWGKCDRKYYISHFVRYCSELGIDITRYIASDVGSQLIDEQ
jgi:hypothetical protein